MTPCGPQRRTVTADPHAFRCAGGSCKLLASAAQANLSHQAGYWLAVEKIASTEKDPTLFPEYTDDVKSQLYNERSNVRSGSVCARHQEGSVCRHRACMNESLAAVRTPGVTGTAFMQVDVLVFSRGRAVFSPSQR